MVTTKCGHTQVATFCFFDYNGVWLEIMYCRGRLLCQGGEWTKLLANVQVREKHTQIHMIHSTPSIWFG